jgi:hypothetical protein
MPFLKPAHRGHTALLSGDVFAATLKIDHDQGWLADDKRPLGVHWLCHFNSLSIFCASHPVGTPIARPWSSGSSHFVARWPQDAGDPMLRE